MHIPRTAVCFSAAMLLAVAAGTYRISAATGKDEATLAVVMTNDSQANEIKVYDAQTKTLLQTLATYGQGGVGGNARGIRQFDGELVAAVNFGSSTIALFKRDGRELKFQQLIPTTSAPVSIEFGNDHLYVAGTTSIDSFVLREHRVGWRDGTALLELVGGGVPGDGSTAQVGVLDRRRVLVTLKTDPAPGTVDVVALDNDGAVTGTLSKVVSAPTGTLTPFGFVTSPDGTAVITLAHSSQDGLFRNDAFGEVIAAGQAAPCWMTRVGKYIYTANTGSKTISRLVATGNHIFVDSLVAGSVTAGGSPSDIDADNGVLGVIDRGAGQAHLSLFTYNQFGELVPIVGAIGIGVPNANGVAIVPPSSRDKN